MIILNAPGVYTTTTPLIRDASTPSGNGQQQLTVVTHVTFFHHPASEFTRMRTLITYYSLGDGMMKKSIWSMVIVCAFSVPALASAVEKSAGPVQAEIKITYSAEMASTAEGRELLERKIRRAAVEVCGPQDLRRAGSLGLMSANRNCYRQAVEEAMRAIKPYGIATTR